MIGKRIRDRREELGLTQDELASMVGYKSKSSINKIESSERNVPFEKLSEIASALNITVGYLIGDESMNLGYISGNLGNRVREARERIGLSKVEASKLVGIDQKELEAIELGEDQEFDRELMMKFCRALDVEPSYFMNGGSCNIGKNMGAIRKMSDINMEEIARKLEVSLERLEELENGSSPSFSEIDKFASIYNIPTQWVINFDFTNIKDNRIILAFRIFGISKKMNEKQLETIYTFSKFVLGD